MSNEQLIPPTQEEINKKIALISKYSQKYKSQVRTILSEDNEAILNTITSMIVELVKKDEQLFILAQETNRLKEMCKKNNIDTKPKLITT